MNIIFCYPRRKIYPSRRRPRDKYTNKVQKSFVWRKSEVEK